MKDMSCCLFSVKSFGAGGNRRDMRPEENSIRAEPADSRKLADISIHPAAVNVFLMSSCVPNRRISTAILLVLSLSDTYSGSREISTFSFSVRSFAGGAVNEGDCHISQPAYKGVGDKRQAVSDKKIKREVT